MVIRRGDSCHSKTRIYSAGLPLKSKPTRSRTASLGRQADAAHRDHIRIVPLHPPIGPVAAAAAQLTYRKGPLISAVEVFTMFWGSGWKASPQAAMIGPLNQFFDYVLT